MNLKKILFLVLSACIFSSLLFSKNNQEPLKLLQEIPASIPSQTDPSDQFNVPFGVAIKNGIAYVTDLGHVRIAKINTSTMQYAGEIKIKSKKKSEEFLMGRPAFDNQGNLWVSDMENGRILKIDENTGEILFQFGSFGENPGQFHASNGLSFDAEGNLWVADELNSRVQKCNPSNGQCTVLETGASSFPQDLAVHGNSLFVCLTWYNKVVEYDLTTMAVVREFIGNDSIKLNTPRGIAIDNTGNVAVSDNLNQRIVVFDSEGNVSRTITYYPNTFNTPQSFGGPTGIKFDSEGNLLVSQSLTHILQKYNSSNALVGYSGKIRNLDFQMNYPAGLSAYFRQYIFSDLYNYRLQIYDNKGVYVKTIAPFNLPKDVLYAKDGKIYVSDYDDTYLNGRIRVYNTDWTLLNTISFPYFYPLKMAMDNNEFLYATDYIMNKVYKISTPDYKIVASYADKGKKYGIGISPINNNIYVSNSDLCEILVLDSSLNLIKTFGAPGSEDQQFFTPLDISFDKNGKYYITDSGNFRIQLFDKNDSWISTFGGLGYSPGHFFGIIVNKAYFENLKGDLFSVSSYLNQMRIYQVSKANTVKGKHKNIFSKPLHERKTNFMNEKLEDLKNLIDKKEKNKEKIKEILILLP